jgi:hypothetical protein
MHPVGRPLIVDSRTRDSRARGPCSLPRISLQRVRLMNADMIGLVFASAFGAAAVVPFIVSTLRTSLKNRR